MRKIFITFLLLFTGVMMAKQNDSTSTAKDSVGVDNFQKTDEVLSKVVDKALTLAEKTGQFVIDQAPDLLREFYLWRLFTNLFYILIGVLLLLGCIYFPRMGSYKEKTGRYDEKFLNRYYYDDFFPKLVFTFGLVISLVLILIRLYDMIFLLAAPKLYIIDYFLDIAKHQ